MSITGVDEQFEAITIDVDSLEPGRKIPGRAKRNPSIDLKVDLCAEFLVQQRSSSSRGEQNEHDKGDDERGESHSPEELLQACLRELTSHWWRQMGTIQNPGSRTTWFLWGC